jgi:hypothetical protein
MTAVKLPGQMEALLVVNHEIRGGWPRGPFDASCLDRGDEHKGENGLGRALAKLLSSYDESPTSQKWIDIQQLAREILK